MVVVPCLVEVGRIKTDAGQLPHEVFIALLHGKRIASPEYCRARDDASVESVAYVPITRKATGVYMTPEFEAKWSNTARAVRHAAEDKASKWEVVADEAVYNSWRKAAKSNLKCERISSIDELHDVAREIAQVDRWRTTRGSYRKKAAYGVSGGG